MKISVCCPNYNHGKYLKENIEGLLTQTHKDWELIIVDDCSTDNSVDVIKDYAKNDNRIKPIFLNKNVGVIEALNTAVRSSEGELIYCSAADDFVCNPKFFGHAIEALQIGGAAGFYGVTLAVDEKTMQPVSKMGFAPYSGYISPQDAMQAFLRGRIFIPGTSVIVRSHLFKEHGGLIHELGPQSDYYANHALAALYGIVFRYETMVTFRVSQQSYSQSIRDSDFFRNHALLEKKMRELPFPYVVDDSLFLKRRHWIIRRRLPHNRGLERAYDIFAEYTGIDVAPEFSADESAYNEATSARDRKSNALGTHLINSALYLFFKLPIFMQRRISTSNLILKTAQRVGLIRRLPE